MTPSKRWVVPLARAGYSARGLIYAIIGLFAVLAALGSGSKTDAEGALQKVMDQPFGSLLVWLLIVGLAGYVVWRLVQSLLDTDDHGWGPKGLAVRIGLLASALSYSALALYSLSLLGVFSGGGGGEGDLAGALEGIVAKRWISLGLALVFAGVALAHWWKALRRKYEDHLDADDRTMAFLHPICIVGLVSRGLVFAVISAILFVRFFTAGDDAEDHPGLKDALNAVQDLPLGSLLLAALGLGLIAFSAYSFAEARWRRINV